MKSTLDPRFVAEVARTLRDEIGARALQGRLSTAGADPELARLYAALESDGAAIEARVRALMAGLGARGRAWSPTRWISSRLLPIVARLGGASFVVRLSAESEEILARRYAGFADWLERTGRPEAARECANLAASKHRRARALRAWVPG